MKAATLHSLQDALEIARTNEQIARIEFNEAADAVPFPEDYDTNDEAADAYEITMMRLEASTGLDAARKSVRKAEAALMDCAIAILCKKAPAFASTLTMIRKKADRLHSVRNRVVALSMQYSGKGSVPTSLIAAARSQVR